MTNTTYLNLKKPGDDDFYNIQDHNDNADLIDAELKSIHDQRGAANGLATLDASGKLVQKPTPVDIGAVPTARTVNQKPLSSDITLTAADVEAFSAVAGQDLKTALETLTTQSLSLKQDLTNEDLDTMKASGMYIQNYTASAATDLHYPVKAAGCLLVIGYTAKAYQYYMCQNDSSIWARRFNSRDWCAWEQLYPTVTSGSNDKGTWVKYPDGTMICYGVKAFSGSLEPGDDETGTKAIIQQIDFPQSFKDTGYVVNAATNLDGGYSAYLGRSPDRYNDFTALLFIMTDSRQTSASGDIRWQAIGRWK